MGGAIFRILGIVSALLLTSCLSDYNSPDLKEFKLRGKVKMIEETSYYAEEKFGEIQKGDKQAYSSEYRIEFDSAGRLVSYELMDAEDGALEAKIKYVHDDQNRIVETNEYDGEGELFRKEKAIYNDDGSIAEKTIYNNDGELVRTTKYIYGDNSSNPSELEEYNEEGKLLNKAEMYYDTRGNVTAMNVYDEDVFYGKVEYVYDQFDQVVKGVFYPEDEDLDESSQETTYVYDSNNNWISKTVIEDGEADEIVERVITYY